MLPRILQAAGTRISRSFDWVDEPSPMRTTLSTVAVVAFSIFAILQNENILWWGFSVGAGMFFHRALLAKDGFSDDMGKVSWKMLLPIMGLAIPFGWTVYWKVTSVFTGLHAGAKFMEWAIWLKKKPDAAPAA